MWKCLVWYLSNASQMPISCFFSLSKERKVSYLDLHKLFWKLMPVRGTVSFLSEKFPASLADQQFPGSNRGNYIKIANVR